MMSNSRRHNRKRLRSPCSLQILRLRKLKILLLNLLILTPPNRPSSGKVFIMNFFYFTNKLAASEESEMKVVYPESQTEVSVQNNQRQNGSMDFPGTGSLVVESNARVRSKAKDTCSEHNGTRHQLPEFEAIARCQVSSNINSSSEDSWPNKLHPNQITYEKIAAYNSTLSSTFFLNPEQNATIPPLGRKDRHENITDIFPSKWSLDANRSNPIMSPNDSFINKEYGNDKTNGVGAFGDRLSEFESCYHRCGNVASFPCSCEERCVVHNNCCKDLAQACPTLYHLALQKFRVLRSANVRCDEKTAVFMIDSCPTNQHFAVKAPSDDNFSFQSDNVTLPNSVPPQTQRKDNKATLLDITLNAPITDVDTGITYANFSIYECNKMPASVTVAQSKGRVKGTWSVGLGSFETNFFLTLNKFQRTIDFSQFSYVPPPSQPSLSGVMCFGQEIFSCISQFFPPMRNQIVCNVSAHEYYKNQLIPNPFVDLETNIPLEHHKCAWCLFRYRKFNGGPYEDRFLANGLRILVSLSENSETVIFNQLNAEDRKVLPWSSWTCDASSFTNIQGIKHSCHLLKCSGNYALIPERECKLMVAVFLAFQASFVLGETKCIVNTQTLIMSIQCYFRSFYNLRALIERPVNVSYFFHEERQANVTILRMAMYTDEGSAVTGFQKLLSSANTISTAVDFFIQRQCLAKEDMEREKSQQTGVNMYPSRNQNTKDSEDIIRKTKLSENSFLQEKNINADFQDPVNPQVTNEPVENTLVYYCIKMNTLEIDIPLHGDLMGVQCDFSSEHITAIFDETFFPKLTASECVQAITGTDNSNGSSLQTSLSSILLLVLGVANTLSRAVVL
ncbi:hypothetical protein PoB_000827600 [Plakobranchus ocellatus]|uniref:SMB domain-containing protein n=1 Tax=Plakobranchus ocellatus TaxID=259542 RepID=A0AAV3Y3E1_9GAST|nr:hypothetical protein PoB_000827600 [Plakobranchus ocellatus]